ncbi:MAG: hypothetical protein RIM99_10985 [Cyclobacteriaceae bacterium]
MIKNALLNRKCRALSKNQNNEHSTYRNASSIGILYNAAEFQNYLISDLINSLEADGKTVARLAFTEKDSEDRFSFCKKNVSMTGNLTKDSISFFAQQRFDFLIALDLSGDMNFKYVLALSKASCKVGIDSESINDFLLMSIKASENQSQNIKELIRYLKMI